MLKIIGCLMIIICTTSIGWFFAQRLQKRVKELETFIAVVKNFFYELNFNRSTPVQIVSAVSSNHRFSDFEPIKLCNEYCSCGEPFHIAWEQAVERGSQYINKEDRQLVVSLCQIIGSSDIKSQNDSLEYYQVSLTDAVLDAKQYVQTHYKLYSMLGILSGAFIVLMLI